MKKIAILGSTGSIGVNTLDVLSGLKDKFRVVALSADTNIGLLSRQAMKLKPKILSVGNSVLVSQIKKMLPHDIKVLSGPASLEDIVQRSDVDVIVFAISGNNCLRPLVRAIKSGKGIALANKEALVSAGPIIMGLADTKRVRIIPIDSEHSAIFQCMESARHHKGVRPSKVILTGSGGPLLDVDQKRFDRMSAEAILKHPRWRMGKKISIDSATMMNKGLEILEAQYLFGMDEKNIDVLIHPEAIVHSMIEFTDSSVIAQMALPDMRLPIQYALTYPNRFRSPVKQLDFASIGSLTFRRVDAKKFPCLGLARRAARAGGVMPAMLCAADDEVVDAYLKGVIKFTDIPKVLEKVLMHNITLKKKDLTIEDVIEAEIRARKEARSLCYH